MEPTFQKEGITPHIVIIRNLQPRDYFMLLNLLYKKQIHLYAIILSHIQQWSPMITCDKWGLHEEL